MSQRLLHLLFDRAYEDALRMDRKQLAADLPELLDWCTDHPDADELSDDDLTYLAVHLAEADYTDLERAVGDWIKSCSKPEHCTPACIFLLGLWHNQPLNRPIDNVTVSILLSMFTGSTFTGSGLSDGSITCVF
jgi:hypothetical protein